MKARLNKRHPWTFYQTLLAYLAAITLILPTIARSDQAQGGGNCSDKPKKKFAEYVKWVKDCYMPDRLKEVDNKKKEVEKGIENKSLMPGGAPAAYIRGAPPGVPDIVAQFDSLIMEQVYFPACNDYRIQSWDKFFKKPDEIFFICSLGITGNDKKTGKELHDLLCKDYDKYGCGWHRDNRHPGLGGVVGIGIVAQVPVPESSLLYLICHNLYLTGSYVEYFFPWNYLNSSRQMYQSTYMDAITVALLRPLNKLALIVSAIFNVVPSFDIFKKVVADQMAKQGYGSPLTANNPVSEFTGWQFISYIINAALTLGEANEQYTDLAPYSTKGYARNFSSVMDIEFMKSKYDHVPHWSLDTHRFGTDLPNNINFSDPNKAKPKDGMPIRIPGAKKTNKDKANVGGLLHSRFQSLAESMKSKIMKEKFKSFTNASSKGGAGGKKKNNGPFVCLRNNKQTGKTPEDFWPSEKKQKDENKMCIDNVTNRFPVLADSFSQHDTDSFWRSLAMGAIDLFYALNWKEFFDASLVEQLITAMFKNKFHTYLENIDRIALNPNSFSSDPDLAAETGFMNCRPLMELPKVNVQYKKANIHDPGWGGQNTAYVFALVKGVWGFKGLSIFIPLVNGTSRYPFILSRLS